MIIVDFSTIGKWNKQLNPSLYHFLVTWVEPKGPVPAPLFHPLVIHPPSCSDYQNDIVLQLRYVLENVPIEYQNDPAIVKIHPMTLVVVSG